MWTLCREEVSVCVDVVMMGKCWTVLLSVCYCA